MPTEPEKQLFEVKIIPPGLTHVTSYVPLIRLEVAMPLCAAVVDSARTAPIAALVMDLAAISKATPRAALYAVRQMKIAPLRRIAFVGGNTFMHALATVVLTVARFPAFKFFSSEEKAIQWAAGAGDEKPIPSRSVV